MTRNSSKSIHYIHMITKMYYYDTILNSTYILKNIKLILNFNFFFQFYKLIYNYFKNIFY